MIYKCSDQEKFPFQIISYFGNAYEWFGLKMPAWRPGENPQDPLVADDAVQTTDIKNLSSNTGSID